MRILQTPRRIARAGFTLIELLAVILIIGILMVFLIPRIPEAINQARVTSCKQNMLEIYKGMMLYQTKFQRAPAQSGVKFFAELVDKGALENTEGVVKRLTCPGVDIGALDLGTIEDPKQWFVPLDQVDGRRSAYAGRDCKNHPLRHFPASGDEALVADDNDGGNNHKTETVVLWGDGSVTTFELKSDKIRELLHGEEHLEVGPGSPIESLRVLSLN